MTEPDFFANLNKLLSSTPLAQLKAYLKWHVIQRSAPGWKRCTTPVSSDLSDLVGNAFVDQLSGADETKTRTKSLIGTIKDIFSGNLDSLTWLDHATVGHALTHGFDNDGSKYDGAGNVKSCWPDAIREGFEERAQCLIGQANRYEVLPGLYVNGARTLTENIADQGGTKLAYLAYKRMAANRQPAPPVAGFNEEQQFFVSYAQSFAEAFGCKQGDRMAPKDRCAVW